MWPGMTLVEVTGYQVIVSDPVYKELNIFGMISDGNASAFLHMPFWWCIPTRARSHLVVDYLLTSSTQTSLRTIIRRPVNATCSHTH